MSRICKAQARSMSGFWRALSISLVLLGFASTAAADARDVLFLLEGANADQLGEALAVELGGRGLVVRRAPAPVGETALERASAAQRAVREAGAKAALWVDVAPAERGGGALLRVVGPEREEVRHAPLPESLATVAPRVFALVAASLLDEIIAPPDSPITVRVEVSIDAGGRPVNVTGSAITTNGTVAAPTSTEPAPVIVVPVLEAPQPVEPAPAPPTEPTVQLPRVEPIVTPETPAPAVTVNHALKLSTEFSGRRVAVGIDFAPFLGMSTFYGGTEVRRLSLGVVGTLDHASEGLAISSVLNLHTGYLRGFDLSGGASITLGPVSGAQLSGAFNLAAGELRGIQLAGGLNVADGNIDGAQLSGGLNVANGNIDGAQFAVGVNLGIALDGAQLAGGGNIATGSVMGLQGSGGFNFAFGDVRGAQLSAGMNLALGDVRGAQAAPLNIATGRVHGLQLGVVNISEQADFALGVLNIFWKGRTHLELTSAESGTTMLALKHGGERFHYIYSVGVRPRTSGDATDFSAGLGLGGRIPISERFFLDVDGIVQHFFGADRLDQDELRLLTTARAMLGFRIVDGISIVAGLSYNVYVSDEDEATIDGLFGTSVLDDRREPGGIRTTGWPGFVAGVQLF